MNYTHPSQQPQKMYDRINKLIQPLVDTFGISHFSYYRCTWAGKVYSFSSHKEWTDYYFANDLDQVMDGFPDIRDISNICRRHFVFYNDYERNNPFGHYVLGAMEKEFGIHHLATYFKPCLGYTWAYTIGFPKEHLDSGRLLLEKREYFEEFLMYFREEAKDIFQTIKQQNYVPSGVASFYAKKKSLYQPITSAQRNAFQAPHRYYIDEFNDNNYLTSREVDCLRCLVHTTNYKKIAAQLDISQQTVQHHINSVRSKLGISNKGELIEQIRMGGLLLGITPDAVTESKQQIESARLNRSYQLQSLYHQAQQMQTVPEQVSPGLMLPPQDEENSEIG